MTRIPIAERDLAMDVLRALRLEDGRTWGEAAASWQLEDARAILAADGPPYHYLTRPRGGSKTTDLAAICVVTLARLRNARLYALAADRDQAAIVIDVIRAFAAGTPSLAGHLDVQAFRVVCPRTGSVLQALAADASSSWGLRPRMIVVDELAQWASTAGPRKLWESASSAAGKMRGCQLVVLTTAGDPAHWSHGVLQHAKADPLWRVNEVPGPVPWADPERLEEARRRLTESAYRRLFLNQWVSAEDRLARDGDLRACVTLAGPLEPRPGRRYVVSVDLGLRNDKTVAGVCHAEASDSARGERRVVLDRMQTWSGSRERSVQLAEVEEWILEASRRFNRAPVVVDPWQAIGSAQRLRVAGVKVVEFSFSSASVGRLASTLHLLIRDHLLALPDDPELLDELANVRLRETSPGVLRMDHDPDKHDDRAICLALAAQHLTTRTRPLTSGSTGWRLGVSLSVPSGLESWNPDGPPGRPLPYVAHGDIDGGQWEKR